MIVDLKQFIERERSTWEELDKILTRIENETILRLTLEEVQRLHYLYERTGAGLIKISTFAAEPNLVRSLESLLTRAYAELQTGRSRTDKLSLRRWLFRTFPQTFRRHFRFFWTALLLTIFGALFGGAAVAFDPDAKAAIAPFPQSAAESRRTGEGRGKQNEPDAGDIEKPVFGDIDYQQHENLDPGLGSRCHLGNRYPDPLIL